MEFKNNSNLTFLQHSLLYKNRGFSLIEAMIAITVTFIMVAGMLVITSNLKKTSVTQNKLSQIEENQLYAFTILDHVIRQGGYYVDAGNILALTALPPTATANPDGTHFNAGEFIVGSTSTNDSISVRFQSSTNDGLMNCLGDTNKSGLTINWINNFSINQQKQLICSVSVNGATAGTPSVLTDGVSALSILYGVDHSGNFSIDTYMTAAQVEGANLWGSVISAVMTITFVDSLNSTVSSPQYLAPIIYKINLMNKS
jgi:type IV pilus assembly protein PilW